MTAPMTFPTFIQAVATEARRIPRNGLLCMAAGSAASIGCELVLWSHRPGLQTTDFGLYGGLALVWVGLSYLVPMLMLGRRASAGGFFKFVATSLALLLPMLAAIALLVMALKMGSAFGLLGLVLLLSAVVLLPMLAGWPLLQANSAGFVSPYWAFKATRGMRWSLVGLSFAVGGMGKTLPGAGTADDLWAALALAALGAAVSFLVAMIGFGMAVVAYKQMAAAFPDPII
ncbi:hypothetical protein [Brevundimonas sp. NIBR11]|uniref:hypothetical protein n=1 Tax=Brevundimonas sp. NIBR11 TaxID=3015999 RepID=UPI0022EFD9A7|nr:hypothetical protein [Brevundimonas sp. NIBR11]WGM32427.1 hypothetical protein KKHFBJBL_02679 [Brevundimonas sp. NIBR11]